MGTEEKNDTKIPLSGAIPYAIGQTTVVRIPIPGTDRLAIEFKARGWAPKGGSTSTLFLQDPTGKRHLRLDYGANPKTSMIDYHWNQKGVYATFGIEDHTLAGRNRKIAYQTAKYFRFAGRVLLVTGVAIDVFSIVQATKPLRRASQVVSAWALAWAGCKAVGAGGAYVGSAGGPIGIAVVGVSGCIAGGVGGYFAGEAIAGEVYDWAEGTFFSPLPVVDHP